MESEEHLLIKGMPHIIYVPEALGPRRAPVHLRQWCWFLHRRSQPGQEGVGESPLTIPMAQQAEIARNLQLLDPERTHEALAATSVRDKRHPKSPAPGHTPLGPAHSGYTGARYARKLPPAGVYSLAPGEKPARGAEEDTGLG
ncbi:hypothetical protein LTR85_010167 [Meristemomyces frigidus]|nr:hypothetical protein LTR85_010167 [Meristemomyces frigidus]